MLTGGYEAGDAAGVRVFLSANTHEAFGCGSANMSGLSTRDGGWLAGFNNLLLAGVLVLILTGMAIGIGLYIRPTPRLRIPDVEPVVRVVRDVDFPVDASRIVNWGERTVLLIRTDTAEYHALDGVSPYDGCVLRWDPQAMRVVSPCRYAVYDLRGNVVAGLTAIPLRRYRVSVRGGWVYVSEGP
jgi:nitrite reductase/ring-hydroxylating ferredoxin subunit